MNKTPSPSMRNDWIRSSAPLNRVDVVAFVRPRLGRKEPSDDYCRLRFSHAVTASSNAGSWHWRGHRMPALHILNLLVINRFPRIWIPAPAERDVRQWVRHRPKLVRIRTSVSSRHWPRPVPKTEAVEQGGAHIRTLRARSAASTRIVRIAARRGSHPRYCRSLGRLSFLGRQADR